MIIPVTPDSPGPRRFTAGDLRLMLSAGILREDERVELPDGELVELAAKGFAHDVVKNALRRRLVPALSETIYLGIESTLWLGPNLLLEPGLLLSPMNARSASPEGFCTVPGLEILLVIEVAVSSLAYGSGAEGGALRPERRAGTLGDRRAGARSRGAPGPKDGAYRDVAELSRPSVLRPEAEELAAVTVPLAALG